MGAGQVHEEKSCHVFLSITAERGNGAERALSVSHVTVMPNILKIPSLSYSQLSFVINTIYNSKSSLRPGMNTKVHQRTRKRTIFNINTEHCDMTVMVLLLKVCNNYLIKWHLDVRLEDVGRGGPRQNTKLPCISHAQPQKTGLFRLALPNPDAQYTKILLPLLCPSSIST